MPIQNSVKNQIAIKKPAGYTTVELIIVVLMVAILSSFAVPSYSSFVSNQHKTTALSSFQHSVILARTEASKSQQKVILCPSVDGEKCNNQSSDFTYGWILFINKDNDYPIVRDSNEQLLQSIKLKKSDFELISNRNTFTFRPTGRRNTNGTVMLCPNIFPANQHNYQGVIISYTGRPRVEKEPKADHIKICLNE